MDQLNNEFANLGDLIYNSSQVLLEQLQTYAIENIKSSNNRTEIVEETRNYYSTAESKKIRLREILSKQLDLLKGLNSAIRYSQLDCKGIDIFNINSKLCNFSEYTFQCHNHFIHFSSGNPDYENSLLTISKTNNLGICREIGKALNESNPNMPSLERIKLKEVVNPISVIKSTTEESVTNSESLNKMTLHIYEQLKIDICCELANKAIFQESNGSESIKFNKSNGTVSIELSNSISFDFTLINNEDLRLSNLILYNKLNGINSNYSDEAKIITQNIIELPEYPFLSYKLSNIRLIKPDENNCINQSSNCLFSELISDNPEYYFKRNTENQVKSSKENINSLNNLTNFIIEYFNKNKKEINAILYSKVHLITEKIEEGLKNVQELLRKNSSTVEIIKCNPLGLFDLYSIIYIDFISVLHDNIKETLFLGSLEAISEYNIPFKLSYPRAKDILKTDKIELIENVRYPICRVLINMTNNSISNDLISLIFPNKPKNQILTGTNLYNKLLNLLFQTESFLVNILESKKSNNTFPLISEIELLSISTNLNIYSESPLTILPINQIFTVKSVFNNEFDIINTLEKAYVTNLKVKSLMLKKAFSPEISRMTNYNKSHNQANLVKLLDKICLNKIKKSVLKFSLSENFSSVSLDINLEKENKENPEKSIFSLRFNYYSGYIDLIDTNKVLSDNDHLETVKMLNKEYYKDFNLVNNNIELGKYNESDFVNQFSELKSISFKNDLIIHLETLIIKGYCTYYLDRFDLRALNFEILRDKNKDKDNCSVIFDVFLNKAYTNAKNKLVLAVNLDISEIKIDSIKVDSVEDNQSLSRKTLLDFKLANKKEHLGYFNKKTAFMEIFLSIKLLIETNGFMIKMIEELTYNGVYNFNLIS